MIIIGYQGIGKTSTVRDTKLDKRYVDLESSNFWINGKRYDDWYIPYTNIAKDLSSQGCVVFVSSHQVVRDQLRGREDVIAIVPAPTLKDVWIQRLEDRYALSGLDKDYKAMMNAKDRYIDNINEIMTSGIDTYYITDINYKLIDVIERIILERARNGFKMYGTRNE